MTVTSDVPGTVVDSYGLTVDVGDLTGDDTAVFSTDRTYRYLLTRRWDHSRPAVVWVMLNPSTADAFVADPTITRCLNFAKAWGAGAITVLNLFAYRATKPRDMNTATDPVGAANDAVIVAVAAGRPAIWIAAWGAGGGHHGRDQAVAKLLRPWVTLDCLVLTKDGQPGHPLYVPSGAQRRPWAPRHTA